MVISLMQGPIFQVGIKKKIKKEPYFGFIGKKTGGMPTLLMRPHTIGFRRLFMIRVVFCALYLSLVQFVHRKWQLVVQTLTGN